MKRSDELRRWGLTQGFKAAAWQAVPLRLQEAVYAGQVIFPKASVTTRPEGIAWAQRSIIPPANAPIKPTIALESGMDYMLTLPGDDKPYARVNYRGPWINAQNGVKQAMIYDKSTGAQFAVNVEQLSELPNEETNEMALRNKTCKYCLVGGFHWDKPHFEQTGHWRLLDASNAVHDCPKRPNHTPNAQVPDADDDADDILPAQPNPFLDDELPIKVKIGSNGHSNAAVLEPTIRVKSRAELLAELLDTPNALDETRVSEMINAALANSQASVVHHNVHVQINDLPAVSFTDQHEQFPILLCLVGARVNTMLVGPAGSGKSSVCEAVATALEVPFYSQSVGLMTSKGDLIGSRDAHGVYHRSPLREAYENGGVWLIDEIDAGNASVLTILNGALSNHFYTFGDGVKVIRHADFVCIAAANTYGTGADKVYVGRNALDGATLDRFFVLDFDYDECFEKTILGIPCKRTIKKPAKSGYTVEMWQARVSQVRKAIAKKSIRHICSPRASFAGAKLLDCLDKQTLEEGLLWKGMNAKQRQEIEAEAKTF